MSEDEAQGSRRWFFGAAVAAPVCIPVAVKALEAKHRAPNVRIPPVEEGAVTEPLRTALRRLGVFGQQFGVVGDGTTDDVAALEAARDAVLALHTANPTWSNMAVLKDDGQTTTHLPGGASLYGLGRIDFQGEVKMSDAADYLEVGLNSVLGETVRYDLAKVTTGYLRVVGVMNGSIWVGQAPKVELWADSSVTGKKSIAYSSFHYGSVATIELNGIDGDGAGGVSPYINSNRHFTQRVTRIHIKSGYPHNMNFFDGVGSDVMDLDIEAGYSNYLEDGRFEVASTFDYATDTHNNYAVNAYYGFRDSYFRRVAYSTHTVTDLGDCNELVEKLDAHYDQKELWAVHANSANYNVALMTRGAASLTMVNNNQIIFDTGIFPLNNPLGIHVEADSAASGLVTPFVYLYDAAGVLITTEPGSDVISLVNGAWQTRGDPLGLNYHYRTSAPSRKTTVALFPLARVAFARVVLRSGGAVNGTTLTSLRVVHTEAKKYNTRIPVLRPMGKGYTSTAGTAATAVPCTAGSFVAGDYVENVTAPGAARTELGSASSKYVVVGWDRLTTGNNHVNLTDWRQRRQPTGN